MSSKKFAVFDIDGTLYRGNLTWDFFNALTVANQIPDTAMGKLEKFYIAHDSRINDNAYSDYDKRLIDTFCESISAITNLENYWTIGRGVSEKSTHKLYKYTREMLTKLKHDGYYLIAITNSVGAVARPFAASLGFDEIVVNEEILNPNKTKIINWNIYDSGRTKAILLANIVEKAKLTYSGSYAFGDTMSDVSMLENVTHPIAFNPEAKLQQLSIAQGWPIIIERKNVIYKLQPEADSFKLVTG